MSVEQGVLQDYYQCLVDFVDTVNNPTYDEVVKSVNIVLAISNYKPETEYTYYWGSGWSKYGFDSMESWNTYLDQYAQSVRNPLKVEF